MADITTPSHSKKNILENPFLSGLVVPVAIVLVGALIIFGVTSLLNSERSSYQNLVREMRSKAFGNRWIAAYELSKYIAAQKIPDEEIPWLLENLGETYQSSVDQRTKKFIIVAVGALHKKESISFFENVIKNDLKNNELLFHAIAALAGLPKEISFQWDLLYPFLDSSDTTLKQSVILTLGTHRVQESIPRIQKFLNDPNTLLKYSSALALGGFKKSSSIPVLKDILNASPGEGQNLSSRELTALKLNVLDVIQKNHWLEFKNTLESFVISQTESPSVLSKAREILKELIN